MTTYAIPASLPKEMFRTYDIRGEASPEGISPDLAYGIGRAIAAELAELGRNEIIVGRDGRLSGPQLKQALIRGLLDSGCDIIDIGVVSSPLVYFATHHLPCDSGVMVTASHNPKDHNGFKVVLGGKTLSTEGVQGLYQRIANEKFIDGKGLMREYDIKPDYVNCITQNITLKRPLKVVIDCGNGAGSVIAPELYRALGCDVVELYCELDGNFPNHHPDPTIPENLEMIIKTVRDTKADLGLAFDGDADRVGVVTDQGEIIWPDRQMMLFAQDVLSRVPGAEIVFDVKCSSNLGKVITANGGTPVMYRTGHSILKAKMLDIGSPLAGEMSGHIFFKEGWFGFDDGVYVGVRLMEIISKGQQSIAEIFSELPNSVHTPELKLPMPEEKKADFMRRLLNSSDFGDAERITIDGLRLDFGFGWGLIRPSNTSPYLILRFEADTEEQLNQIKNLFCEQLLKLDADLQLPF